MVSRVPSPAWGWQEAAWGGGREGLATSCYPGPEVPLGVGLGHALGEAFALSSWLWSGLRTGTWESVSGQAFPAPGGGGGAVTQKREALPASPRRPSCSPVGESGTARAGGADLRLPSPPLPDLPPVATLQPAPSGHGDPVSPGDFSRGAAPRKLAWRAPRLHKASLGSPSGAGRRQSVLGLEFFQRALPFLVKLPLYRPGN